MNSSSASESQFEGVKWTNILSLLRIVAQSTSHGASFIENRYRDEATDFAATAKFLSAIKLLQIQEGQILSGVVLSHVNTSPQDAFLRHLIEAEEFAITEELLSYISGFTLTSGMLVRQADSSMASEQGPVRNFLMGMGIVTYQATARRYMIEPSHAWIFAVARTDIRPLRPSRLLTDLKAKGDLGLAAELKVVEWEQNRLGVNYASRVRHVALADAAAGFDVLSATIEGDRVVQRFIEVKAVPKDTLRFFWTQNEAELANVLGPLYYLYLVPIGPGGVFEINQMTIIRDPCSAVLNGDNWETEANVLKCQLRRTNSTEGASDR